VSIIGLIVFLIIIGLIFWAVNKLAGAFAIPAPLIAVIHVVLVVVAILWLLSTLGLMSGGPVIRFN